MKDRCLSSKKMLIILVNREKNYWFSSRSWAFPVLLEASTRQHLYLSIVIIFRLSSRIESINKSSSISSKTEASRIKTSKTETSEPSSFSRLKSLSGRFTTLLLYHACRVYFHLSILLEIVLYTALLFPTYCSNICITPHKSNPRSEIELLRQSPLQHLCLISPRFE